MPAKELLSVHMPPNVMFVHSTLDMLLRPVAGCARYPHYPSEAYKACQISEDFRDPKAWGMLGNPFWGKGQFLVLHTFDHEKRPSTQWAPGSGMHKHHIQEFCPSLLIR